MFRFLVKFLKILTIVCLIGVALRIVEVAFYKKDNIQEEQQVAQVMSDNIVVEDNKNITLTEEQENVESNSKIDTKKEENTEKKDIKEAEQTTTKVNKNEETNKKQETSSNKQKEVVEEKQEIQKKETVQEIPKQEEIKKETQTEENYTEFEVKVVEKKECEGNNHGIGVGNSNKWFNTKDEAIAEYRAEIKKWGDLWTDKENPISNEEYYKNCPYGYEVWNCMFCGKWTLNYYYDK